MLGYLREHQKTFLWVLLGFIILPFIVYYGAPGGGNMGPDRQPRNVAMVNDQPVPWYEYEQERSRIENQMEQRARQQGQRVPREQERQIPNQAFENVVGLEVLRQTAVELGIEVTAKEIRETAQRQIQQIAQQYQVPQERLQDFERQFIRDAYPGRTYEDSVARFKADLRDQILFNKVMRLPSYGTVVSEGDVRAEFDRRNASARVETVMFKSDDYLEEVSATFPDDVLSSYLEQHKDEYREPLKAKILYAHFTGFAFEEQARTQVTPTDVQREFNTRANQYREPETRRVEHILFGAEDFIADATFSEDELEQYFEENQNEYVTEERARARYITLSPMDVRDEVEITDEDLETYYERYIHRYRTPASVEIHQILAELPVVADPAADQAALEKIQQAQDRLAAGEEFEAVAQDLSDDENSAEQGGSLGQIVRGMGPPYSEFEDVAFGLEEGEVSEPVKTSAGYHLLKAGARVAASTTPLADVRDTIYESVLEQEARQLARETLTRIRNGLEEGLTPGGVGEEFNITSTRTFPEGDTKPVDATVGDNMSSFASTVFRLDQGDVSQPVELGDRFFLIERTETIEPQPMDLADAEVRETVAADLAAEKAISLANLEGRQAMEDLRKTGMGFRQLALKNNLEVFLSDWLTSQERSIPNVGQTPTAFLRAVFGAELGEILLADGPDGSVHLVRVTGIRPSEEPAFEDLSDEEINEIANDLVQSEAVRLAALTAAEFMSEAEEMESDVNLPGLFSRYAGEYGIESQTTDFFTVGEPIDNVLSFNTQVAEAAIEMATAGVTKGELYNEVIESGRAPNYSYTVFQLVDYQPAHIPALVDVRADVLEAYRREKALERAKAAADAAANVIAQNLPATYPPADGSRSVDLKTLANEQGWDYHIPEAFNREGYIDSVGRAPEFKKVAFQLEPGEVSGVITVHGYVPAGGDPKPSGYFILQVLEKEAPSDTDFAEQREQLVQEMQNRRGNMASRSWFENLKEQADIEDLRVASGYEAE